jgi:hypothetical protein
LRRPALPTIIPRLIVFCLLVAIGVLRPGSRSDAWRAPARRRVKHGAIWRLLGAPLSNAVVLNRAIAELWNLIRGAAAIAPPRAAGSRAALHRAAGREPRQPGSASCCSSRTTWTRGATCCSRCWRAIPAAVLQPAPAADGGRAAEAFDLAGVGREHVIDALAASLCVPIATDPHLCGFRRRAVAGPRPPSLRDRPGGL